MEVSASSKIRKTAMSQRSPMGANFRGPHSKMNPFVQEMSASIPMIESLWVWKAKKVFGNRAIHFAFEKVADFLTSFSSQIDGCFS